MQATQEVISRVPQTTEEEFNAAVESASQAFKLWRKTPVSARARVMFKLQQLIREQMVRPQWKSKTLLACRLVLPQPELSSAGKSCRECEPRTGQDFARCKGRCLSRPRYSQQWPLYCMPAAKRDTMSRSLQCISVMAAEVVEYASSIAGEMRGDYVEHVSTGMDTYSIRQPIGVRLTGCLCVTVCTSSKTHTSNVP